MESEAGNASGRYTSTIKEVESHSPSEKSDAFTSKSLDRRIHNDVSCISEIKHSSNAIVKKKRGRRAPPSSRSLSGKKADQVIGTEDAANNYNHTGEEGQDGKSQFTTHIKEFIDGRTGGVDLSTPSHSGDSSDGASSPSRKTERQDQSANGYEKSIWIEKESGNSTSKQDKFHLIQDGLNSGNTDLGISLNKACEKTNALEDASVVQAAAVNVVPEERTSPKTMDDEVFDAQLNTTAAEYKSSEEVEDVKVCDICGDVGEEEKLAVCSRCNDGAEHIYCMRVMMEEVPESEWLCEECQTELELEKEKMKLEKSHVKVGASKGQSFEGKTSKLVNASKIRSASEDEASKGQSFEGKPCKLINALKGRSSSQNEVEAENGDNKDLNEMNQGNNITMRKKEEDAGVISSVRKNHTDFRKKVPMSRENSSRLHVEKGKQPTTQVPTSLASNAAKNQAPPLRGQFSKSTSFNNSRVPKVKQLVNEVPQKPNNLKDYPPFFMKKEGPTGILAKSPFFKKPKSCEPANKEKSSVLPPFEEPKVMDPLVSHNASRDKGTSILGCPSTASMATPVLSKEESTTQYLTTGNNMADSNDLSITQGQDAHCELNQPLLAKALESITSSAERSASILACGGQRKVIENSDPSDWADEVKDPTSLRPGASGSSRTTRCQRCNEVGHCTQFCSVDKLSFAAVKPGSERNFKDASTKRNKTIEAISVVATEKTAARLEDQSMHILKCGPYHNPIYRSKEVLSTSSFSNAKKSPQLYVRTNEQDVTNNLPFRSYRPSTDCSKLKSRECQTAPVTSGRSVNCSFTMPSALMDKASQSLSPNESIVATVPELDCIWQGGFELWRTGRSPELCDGFQAHLSCTASPKVLEVAKKFPSKVQLEELPRQCSWPSQFLENGPSYDNIGLFFFARDTHSYENYYSKLVENMLKNDLALRGNIETAELLIFPSNILSKNFQRWNTIYFLWGVFRVRRKDKMNLPSDVPISACDHNLNVDPMDVDLGISVLSSGPSFSEDHNNHEKTDYDFVNPAASANYQCVQTTEANHQRFASSENLSNQPVGGSDSEDCHHYSVKASSSTNINIAIVDYSTGSATKHQKFAYSKGEDKMKDSSSGNAGEVMLDVNMAPVTRTLSSIHETSKHSMTIDLNNAENIMHVDVNSSEVTEVNPSSFDPISHGPHKRNVEIANWAVEVNGTHPKKNKLDNVGSSNSSLNDDTRDGKLSCKMHPLAASSFDASVEDRSLLAISKGNGKCIFPLDLNVVDNAVTGNIVNIVSSDDEDLPDSIVPDHKLELGDNKSPRKAMFAFLSPKVCADQDKEYSLPIDTSGSLSLSLAFPASKEQPGKLQSDFQRQLPEVSSRNKLSSIWDRQ